MIRFCDRVLRPDRSGNRPKSLCPPSPSPRAVAAAVMIWIRLRPGLTMIWIRPRPGRQISRRHQPHQLHRPQILGIICRTGCDRPRRCRRSPYRNCRRCQTGQPGPGRRLCPWVGLNLASGLLAMCCQNRPVHHPRPQNRPTSRGNRERERRSAHRLGPTGLPMSGGGRPMSDITRLLVNFDSRTGVYRAVGS